MKRLLLAACGLVALLPLRARGPAVNFDLPYRMEHGKYFVELGTPAGPRRFVFDTGASHTVVSEHLSRLLGAEAAGETTAADFEGHRMTVRRVRIPYLRMGEADYRGVVADVLPDSSYLFACLGADGIVGSDLLSRFVVRMPNADSTITLTDDVRTLPEVAGRRACRLAFAGPCPLVPIRVRSGRRSMKTLVKFDTGASGLFYCRYDECRSMARRGLLDRVRRTVGHSGHLGVTNLSQVGETMRGVAPCAESGGLLFDSLPVVSTRGGFGKLGCAILDRCRVVVDYPGGRFWLLPSAERSAGFAAWVTNVTVALDGGRLVVGQVWDEGLAGTVAPGDRIVRLGTVDVSDADPCAVLRGELRADCPEITVERADGVLVTVPLKKM